MIWESNGIMLAPTILGALVPLSVLYEFDGPKLFVTEHLGMPLLVYESHADDVLKLLRLLVVPTNKQILAELEGGECFVYDALDHPWLFVVDQHYDGRIVRVNLFRNGLASVPRSCRPDAMVTLIRFKEA